MVAIYPTGIKNFTYKTDFTDIVHAGDVNVSYDEIRAIENTLGTSPNVDNINGTTYTWPTVSSRISAVSKGVSNPFCNVVINNALATQQSLPDFTGVTWDTHGMWSGGSNIVCKRSGVYTFSYNINWYSPSAPGSSFIRDGFVKSSLTVVGSTHAFLGNGGFFPAGWTVGIEQSASITMPWVKGSAVFLTLNQNVASTVPYYASVSALFERDVPSAGNL
jgi:hypothetical protein